MAQVLIAGEGFIVSTRYHGLVFTCEHFSRVKGSGFRGHPFWCLNTLFKRKKKKPSPFFSVLLIRLSRLDLKEMGLIYFSFLFAMKNQPNIRDLHLAKGKPFAKNRFVPFFSPVRTGSPNAFINYSQRSPIIEWRKLASKNIWISKREICRLDELERILELPRSEKVRSHEYFLR